MSTVHPEPDLEITDLAPAAAESSAAARAPPPALQPPARKVQHPVGWRDDRKSLHMELTRVEFHNVDEIDCTNQTFQARIYLTLRIAGGALDDALKQRNKEFPVDEAGNPTFKPSARWYAEQIDFTNSEPKSSTVLDRKAMAVGDDMEIKIRFDGQFHQPMSLSHFPFDEQNLGVSFAIYCRKDGPVPVNLTVSKTVVMDIRERGFALSYLWELDRTLFAYTSTEQYGGREFPTMTIGLHVLRRPWFVLKVVALPMCLMSLLTFVQYAFKYEHINDRVTGMLTLVLTAAASKLSSQSFLPSLSYATLLDRYTFALDGVIFGAAIISGIVSMMNRLESSDDEKVLFERACFIVQLVFWLAVHLWFAIRGFGTMSLARDSMVAFRSARDRLRDTIVKIPSLEDPKKTVRVRRAKSDRVLERQHTQTVRQLALDD